jgi:Zn-dependent protease with chaperone function
VIGLLEVVGIGGAAFALLAWAGVVALAPRDGLGGLHLSARRRLWVGRAWLLGPVWVPVVVLASASLPGLLGVVSAALDHCVAHAGAHHHHLCWLHPPHASGHLAAWLLPGGVGLLTVLRLGPEARRMAQGARWAPGVAALGRIGALGPDVRVLEAARPLALAVGWRRPVVLVSEGLVSAVDAATLAAVVAHERAHIARGDTRWAAVERLAARLLPARVADPLLARVHLAREQVCDAAAAEVVGSRVVVARALTRVARLGLAPGGVSIAGAALEARVRQLLDPPGTRRPVAPLMVLVGLVLAGIGPLHAAVEYGITALLH